MKGIALPLSASLFLFFASCSETPSKNSGDEQVPQPVLNSGPETEASRANKAVQDSAEQGHDKKDSTASNAKDHH
jgi:hypothetical protein